MSAPFAGLFTGSSPVAPAAPSGPKGAFTGIFTAAPAPATAPAAPKQPVVPVSAAPIISPSTTPNAFKGNLGGGYGASTILDLPGDKSSNNSSLGKPLLTYENDSAKSSQLLPDRVAPTFDPTIPQKIDPSVLENGRMPQSASDAVRKATGAEPDEQLDHLISLELGGSNQSSNLNLEKLKSDGTQPSLDLENQTAKQVASGQISYIDGQKIIARAKGVQLPDDQDFASSTHPLAQDYPNAAPNQTGTQSQQSSLGSKVKSFFSGIFNTAKNAVTSAVKAAQNTNTADTNLETKAAANAVPEAGNIITQSKPFDLLARVQGGESIAQGITEVYGHLPTELNATDINNIVSIRQGLINKGVDPKQATIQAAQQVHSQKASGAASGMIAPENDLSDISDDIFKSLAGETDPDKIVSILKGQNVDEEGAQAIAPMLAKTQTPEQAKAVMTTALDNGIIRPANGVQAGEETAEATAPKSLPGGDAEPNLTPEAAPAPPDRTPVVNLDEQAKNEAGAMTVAGKGNGVNGLDSDAQQMFRDWVNQSGESNKAISGHITAKPFDSLRGQGMDAVHAFQGGDRTGQLADVEQWGKETLAREQSAGIPVDAKKNYLPQYWANSPAEIDKAQARYLGDNPGKSISLKPGFSKESVFPDYATGEKYGLKPKYNNIPDMINARTQASEKALADRTFFERAAARGLVIPASHAGEGWETVPRFPKYTIKGSDGNTYTGLMAMPKPLADLVNNHLNAPQGTLAKVLQKTATAATVLKQIVLTSGIFPKTAINLHGFNELASTVPEAFNHPSLFLNALKYMLYPKSAQNFIDANLSRAKEAALDGVQLGGEERTINNLIGAFNPNGKLGKAGVLINQSRQLLYNSFAKPLFEQMIPALKLQMYTAEKDALTAKGVSQAGRIAAGRANKTFGGMNLSELGRDKNLQNFLKTFTLAPDFWEARYKYVGNAGMSLFTKGPTADLYRKVALAIGGAYIAMNLANKKTSGNWMFQNPAGHSMDVLIGHDSKGKDIWFRPFGTTLDLLRLPMDLAQSIIQNGDVSGISTDIRDRVSALVQPIATLTYNTDAFGNTIFQPATPSDPLSKQVAAFAATLPIVPSNISNLTGLANPNESTAQSVSQAAGVPLRFNSATPSSVNDLANLIYSERTTLETQIKKEYVSGDTKDALDQMAQYNSALLEDTINSYEAQGHKITDKQAFTNWLVSTDQKNGGIKDLIIKPPSATSISNTKAKQGKPLFNKIFPSTITQ